MSLAITMNLIAIAIVVGGWTAAVWVFYRRLSDPHTRQGNAGRPAYLPRVPAQRESAEITRETVGSGRHAS